MLLQDAAGDVSHLYIAGATCDPAVHPTCQLGPYTAVIPLGSSGGGDGSGGGGLGGGAGLTTARALRV
jgi:hypothetical protein